MTTGLKWLIEKAEVTKVYPGECIEKSFTGKIPYRMAMDVIQKNDWDNVTEAGFNTWSASKMNMGLNYNTKTGIMSFSFYEA